MEIVRCRCCLTPNSSAHYPLFSIIADLPGGVHQTILKTLQIVISTDVVVLDNLPNEVCEPCLLNLKVSYEFIVTFKESQILLNDLQQQIYDVVKTKNFNSYESTSLVEEKEIVLVGHNVKDLNNGLLDHNYSSQIKDEAVDNPTHDTEENISGITIMTIEDVLKEEKKRRKRKVVNGEATSEVITKGAVEDVIEDNQENLQKKCQVKSIVVSSSHVRRKTSEGELGAYKCDGCDLVYQTKVKLNRHKYLMHNANWMEVFKCSSCGESFDTGSKLRHHKESKHQDKLFACHLCGKVFRIKQHLKVHIREKHSSPDQFKHLCSQCGRRFRSSCALKYHLRQHDNIKNYICRFCGFRSASACGVQRHERIHTGEKPFLCRYCPKNFCGRGDLDKHELTHTGIKPHKCSYCPKTFTQTYNKKVHMMQHSGEYGCEMCKRKFIDMEVLKFHYRVKHRIDLTSTDESMTEK